MTLSESIEAATAIVDRFPNGGLAAGKGYIGAIAATLAGYPRQVATRCAELNGVVRDCQFLPTVADVVAWCERATAPLHRDYEREKRVREQLAERAKAPQPKPSGKKQYTYGEFLEWAKDNGRKPRPIGRFEEGAT